MNIQCQGCKSSCLRLDEIIDGKCKYCGHDLFTVVFEDETESGVELPCSGVLSDADSYAYKNLAEYEDIVECKMNSDFRTGWFMGRITMQKLRALGGEEEDR